MFSRLRENGISAIPIKIKTGAAFFNNWQQFSDRLPTEEEADEWDRLYKIGDEYGVAVVLGKASGLMCSDIDVVDPAVHALVPKSPYGKRGLPGRATYFYKYNSRFENIGEGKRGVGLRVSNQYTIIPPSKHRKFDGPYVCLGKDLCDLDRDELPEINDISWLDLISVDPATIQDEGRNNYLKRVVTAMRIDCKPENEIVKFIYEWDKKNHKPRLFTDPKEQWRAKSEDEAIRAAHRFVNSVTSSLLKSNLDIRLPFQKKEIEIITDQDKFTPRAYPEAPQGLFSKIVGAARASAKFENTPIGLGAALSIGSMMCAHRFTLNGTAPNLMIMNLFGSGFGKGAGSDLVNDVMAPFNLVGAATYASAEAFVDNLSSQPVRVDCFSEAKSFLDSMKSNGNYKSKLCETVNEVYSSGTKKFRGLKSISAGKMARGECWCPIVTIYGSTHEAGFLDSATGYLAESGLLPRNVIFVIQKPTENQIKLRDPIESRRLVREIIDQIADFFHKNPILYDDSRILDESGSPAKRPITQDYPMSDDARMLLQSYEIDCTALQLKCEEEDAPYIGRFHENAEKIALITAVLSSHPQVELSDARFAIELVETCFYNAKLTRKQVVNSGYVTGPISKVFALLNRHGKLSRTALGEKVELRSFQLDTLLKPYLEEGRILTESLPGKSKPTQFYFLPGKDA